MIWSFRKRPTRGVSTELSDAADAVARAEQVEQQVRARTREVDVVVAQLKQRRIDNNFGEALEIAMARRV